MTPAMACAQVLVDEFIRNGVRHVVLCPGSRSAPLAFAVSQAATAGRLTLHVRTDERSAAFVALGLAKRAEPALVITTSGTAVANLHPAMLEAAHAGVPLIAVTADRPPELRGTGANQTTVQPGIFGAAARWTHDLGTPDERDQNAQWRAVVCRLIAAVTNPGHPGPGQLNVPFREPLVPAASPPYRHGVDGRADGQPWTRPIRSAAVGPRIADGGRTVMIVGDLPWRDGTPWGEAAAELAQVRGWPVIAEPSSGARGPGGIAHGPLVLTDHRWLAEHMPDRILVVGRVTLARAVAGLIRIAGLAVDLVTPHPWPDPACAARQVYPLDSLLVTEPAPAPSIWRDSWVAAGRRVAAAVTPVIESSWPSGVSVARVVARELGADAVLFAGPSNAVRDLDLAADAGPRIVANRGLAGIDGCLSTAMGLALARPGEPHFALVGDLTFAHDLGAWLVGPLEPRPDLTVIVLNDDGGGIFSLLEPGQAEFADQAERIFGTPLGLDLAQLCGGLGCAYRLVSSPVELRSALGPPQGLTVVEVRIDRASHRRTHDQLRQVAAESPAGSSS